MDSYQRQTMNVGLDGWALGVGLVLAGGVVLGLASGVLLSETMETNISKEWPVVVAMALLTYPPLYSKRVRDIIGAFDKRRRGGVYAGLMFACLIFWMFFSEGLCVRLDLFPQAPRAFETVVVGKTMHNGVVSYVSVQERRGGVHQLRMHDASPEPGQPILFSAREGLLGVLYDIEYIKD